MDLEFGEKYEAFRSEVRSFLTEQKPAARRPGGMSSDQRAPLVEWLTKHGDRLLNDSRLLLRTCSSTKAVQGL